MSQPVYPFAGQSADRFEGVIADIAEAQPKFWKWINPDDNVCREAKQATGGRIKNIVRIFTGQPAVDDWPRWPNATSYGRLYCDLVYSQLKDPDNVDYLEMENEPNDRRDPLDLTRFIQRMGEFMLGFIDRLEELNQQHGTRVKAIGPNFPVGWPEVFVGDMQLWPHAWRGLVPALRRLKAHGGMLGVHEYGAPTVLESWAKGGFYPAWREELGYGTCVGRILAVYRCLPDDLQDLQCIIGEGLIDHVLHGVTGGFWYGREGDAAETAPAWYMDQLQLAWDKVYSRMPQLFGIAHFIHNHEDPTWELYSTVRTASARAAFRAFMRKPQFLRAAATPPAPPPKEQPPMTYPDSYYVRSLPALALKALELRAGSVYTGEWPVMNDEGKQTHVAQVYGASAQHPGGVFVVELGKWDQVEVRDHTGKLLPANPAPPPPPPTDTTPGKLIYKQPPALALVGAQSLEGVRRPGEPFFRLTGATVQQGVSAYVIVTVFSRGAPAIGRKVVALFPDGNGEVHETDGSGRVEFQLTEKSAFTNPGDGTHTVFIANDLARKDFDAKRIVDAYNLSDVVKSLGDFRGEHTTVQLQFIED